jgi:hypothetical protein
MKGLIDIVNIAPRIKHKAASFIVAASFWACWIKFFIIPANSAWEEYPIRLHSHILEPIVNLLRGWALAAWMLGSGALFIFAYARIALWRREFERKYGIDQDVG